MEYIIQNLLPMIVSLVKEGKIVVINGPRRCGKTTLVEKFAETLKEPHLFVTGDDLYVREYLGSPSIDRLKSFIGGNKFLFVDEAQHIENIGLSLKLIFDALKDVRVVITGSSSFKISQSIDGALVGRSYHLTQYPLSMKELSGKYPPHVIDSMLEERAVYGSYPEVILMEGHEKKQRYLLEIVSTYLLTDILLHEGIKKSDKILKLLQMLSLQIGKEVSFTELGSSLGMSKNTVEKYCDLLEKAFVIFPVRGFSRNLRKEITKNHRYYFFDNGIRNALIKNFSPLPLRIDAGMLWENFVIIERIKKQQFDGMFCNNYFWRTYDQEEIDFIEERDGKLSAFEIKMTSPSKVPAAWKKAYPESMFENITMSDWRKFLL